MSTKQRVMAFSMVATLLGGLFLLTGDAPTQAAPKAAGAAKYLKNVQTGNPKFKTIGRLSFGPSGLLLVADPGTASVVAIDTGDTGPVNKLKKRIDNVEQLLAKSIGATSVKITDLAVNQLSGKIYLAVNRNDAILTIDGDGKVGTLDMAKLRFVRVTLPADGNARVSNITDVSFADDRILAAGQSGKQFSSKIYSLPLPLEHGASANIFSAETYHVAHRRWETRAPIQSFIPFTEDGKDYVVGSFACTPIAKFPIGNLKSGAKVKGTSIVELGSGNRPLDMFTYEKDGKRWIVTNTMRFHKNLFGPSKYWGVRIESSYLTAKKVNEEAARRDIKTKSGPEGIEIVEALSGAVQVDKLSNTEMVVLRDDNGKLNLEIAPLP
jgi:hypothetical protein